MSSKKEGTKTVSKYILNSFRILSSLNNLKSMQRMSNCVTTLKYAMFLKYLARI